MKNPAIIKLTSIHLSSVFRTVKTFLFIFFAVLSFGLWHGVDNYVSFSCAYQAALSLGVVILTLRIMRTGFSFTFRWLDENQKVDLELIAHPWISSLGVLVLGSFLPAVS